MTPMWDTDAQKLAVKAIGTVESNLKYDAVNYSDPITVGAFQWFGVRAANVIQRMGVTDPGCLDTLPSSLLTDLDEYNVYDPSAVPVRLAYGNMKAHYYDGEDGFTALTTRAPALVSLIRNNCDVFGACELVTNDGINDWFLTQLQGPDAVSASRINEYTDPRCTAVGPWMGSHANWAVTAETGSTDIIPALYTYVKSTFSATSTTSTRGIVMYQSDLTTSPVPSGSNKGFPVTAGDTITFSLYVRSTKSGSAEFAIRFLTGTTWVDSIVYSGAANLTPGVWQRFSITTTVPTGATYMAARVLQTAAWVTNDHLDISGVLIEKVAALGSYFDPTSLNGNVAPIEISWEGATNASRTILYSDAGNPTDWQMQEGTEGNMLLYRSSLYTAVGTPKIIDLDGGNKSMCDFRLRQNATGYEFHVIVTHFLNNDMDAEINSARTVANHAKDIPRCVLVGDFNEWHIASGYPKAILKNKANLVPLQQRGSWPNDDKDSWDGGSTGHWIDDILTRPGQIVTNGAMIPTNGASDHWGWIKVTVDFDGTKKISNTISEFWSSRYLTQTEGSALKPILFDHQSVQNTQALEDFNAYVEVAMRHDMDADDNTLAMIFFMVMYHQSPKQALAVLNAAGADSSLKRLYNYSQKNSVLSKYPTRYLTAYEIISEGDSTGIDLGNNTGSEDTEEDTGGDPGNSGNAVSLTGYVRQVGPNLHLFNADGQSAIASPTGMQWWSLAGSVVDDSTTVDVGGTDVVTGDTDGERLVQWMLDHIGSWKYSQKAGRLNPVKNGYTDCSGCIWYCYKKVLGIDIGTWTGTQYKHGKLITTNRSDIRNGVGLQPGDLIFYHAYRSSSHRFNHVEMYTGDSQHRTIGQVGSDDPGPNLHPMSRYLDWAKLDVMARRYV